MSISCDHVSIEYNNVQKCCLMKKALHLIYNKSPKGDDNRNRIMRIGSTFLTEVATSTQKQSPPDKNPRGKVDPDIFIKETLATLELPVSFEGVLPAAFPSTNTDSTKVIKKCLDKYYPKETQSIKNRLTFNSVFLSEPNKNFLLDAFWYVLLEYYGSHLNVREGRDLKQDMKTMFSRMARNYTEVSFFLIQHKPVDSVQNRNMKRLDLTNDNIERIYSSLMPKCLFYAFGSTFQNNIEDFERQEFQHYLKCVINKWFFGVFEPLRTCTIHPPGELLTLPEEKLINSGRSTPNHSNFSSRRSSFVASRKPSLAAVELDSRRSSICPSSRKSSIAYLANRSSPSLHTLTDRPFSALSRRASQPSTLTKMSHYSVTNNFLKVDYDQNNTKWVITPRITTEQQEENIPLYIRFKNAVRKVILINRTKLLKSSNRRIMLEKIDRLYEEYDKEMEELEQNRSSQPEIETLYEKEKSHLEDRVLTYRRGQFQEWKRKQLDRIEVERKNAIKAVDKMKRQNKDEEYFINEIDENDIDMAAMEDRFDIDEDYLNEEQLEEEIDFDKKHRMLLERHLFRRKTGSLPFNSVMFTNFTGVRTGQHKPFENQENQKDGKVEERRKCFIDPKEPKKPQYKKFNAAAKKRESPLVEQYLRDLRLSRVKEKRLPINCK
ncbi:cytochrome P450 [Acrasis kona]|uniref:Cytochrome P450 n=1 Tax=Acrasis kona TaxID=1008807 RepID=A0AAW2YWG7_9EUKA